MCLLVQHSNQALLIKLAALLNPLPCLLLLACQVAKKVWSQLVTSEDLSVIKVEHEG